MKFKGTGVLPVPFFFAKFPSTYDGRPARQGVLTAEALRAQRKAIFLTGCESGRSKTSLPAADEGWVKLAAAAAVGFSFAGLSPAKEKSTCRSLRPLRLKRSGR
jgi:hypothetical protein